MLAAEVIKSSAHRAISRIFFSKIYCHRIIFVSLLWPFLLGTSGRGTIELAPLFQDHAVLQRDRPVSIWGWADPGESVTVSFAGQQEQTIADSSGAWQTRLAPMAACVAPASLVVEGTNRIVCSDIVVGDVWLGSGQSNLAWSVGAADNPDAETEAANWPLIRQIKIDLEVSDKREARVGGTWKVCSPSTVGVSSAVGYYFARELHRTLQIPVGLINCSFGGSSIEAWLSPEALAADARFIALADRWRRTVAAVDPAKRAAFSEVLDGWQKAVMRAHAEGFGGVAPMRPWPPPGPGHYHTPSGLFNGMLAPLVPYTLRGFIWYQGEANVAHSEEYKILFPALIADWRHWFGDVSLPFYWVQLPNFEAKDESGKSWALFREAQAATLNVKGTGQAITIDIGNIQNIHPGNKQEVGRRLALIAQACTYSLPVIYRGPRPQSIQREGTGLWITFDDAAGGLLSRGAVEGFEVAGVDGLFVSAFATIDSRRVYVYSPQVATPMSVRYAWANAPQASLFNRAGLPMEPFRYLNIEAAAVPLSAPPKAQYRRSVSAIALDLLVAVGRSAWAEFIFAP